jgi:hypothetical protein
MPILLVKKDFPLTFTTVLSTAQINQLPSYVVLLRLMICELTAA